MGRTITGTSRDGGEPSDIDGMRIHVFESSFTDVSHVGLTVIACAHCKLWILNQDEEDILQRQPYGNELVPSPSLHILCLLYLSEASLPLELFLVRVCLPPRDFSRPTWALSPGLCAESFNLWVGSLCKKSGKGPGDPLPRNVSAPHILELFMEAGPSGPLSP